MPPNALKVHEKLLTRRGPDRRRLEPHPWAGFCNNIKAIIATLAGSRLGAYSQQIRTFVDHYNHCRYHESLGNLTPADVYTGRGQAILERRSMIKQRTIEHRRLLHQQATA